MSEFSQWPSPPAINACELVKKCEHCQEDIEVDEPCIEIFYGVLGRSKKSGFLMVQDAGPTPEQAIILHPYCVVDYALDNIDDAMPDAFGEDRCEFCDSKLDPRWCPSCGRKQD